MSLANIPGAIRTALAGNKSSTTILPSAGTALVTYPLTDAVKKTSSVKDFGDVVNGILETKPDGKVERPQFKPIFESQYLTGPVSPATWRDKLTLAERDLIARVDEAAAYAKHPDSAGAWNFFVTLYRAAEEGLGLIPPINVWDKFRPEIVWHVRQRLIGGGLELVAKNIRYASEPWEGRVIDQLTTVDKVGRMFGVDIANIARTDMFHIFQLLTDTCRRRIELAKASGDLARADALGVVHSELSQAYGFAFPLYTVSRLGHGNINWKR